MFLLLISLDIRRQTSPSESSPAAVSYNEGTNEKQSSSLIRIISTPEFRFLSLIAVSMPENPPPTITTFFIIIAYHPQGLYFLLFELISMAFIELNSVKIHFQKTGKGSPLIFLHGIFCHSELYSEMLSILSSRYTVYAIDLPGHGKSPITKELSSLDDYVAMLHAFIQANKIKSLTICCHSMSTLLGICYAAKFPARELILIEPLGIKYYNSRIHLLFKLGIVKTFSNIMQHPIKGTSLTLDGMKYLLKNISNRQFWEIFNRNFKKDFSPEMKRIKCHVKILWAIHDEVFPIKFSEDYKKRYSNAQLIRIDGSHDWPLLKPEEIRKIFSG